MALVAAATAAMSIWIVLWALGSKGFDAFMVFLLLIVVSITLRGVASKIPGRRGSDD